MYPFNILIVKKEQEYYYRVVYQNNRSIDITVDQVQIVCSALPEFAMWDDHGTLYLRGHDTDRDHFISTRVSKTAKEFLMSINDKLKLLL